MAIKHPDYLVATDKERDRVFVLARPHLIAVKMDGQWCYGMEITDQEIKENYELELDKEVCENWIEEAKIALNISRQICQSNATRNNLIHQNP